MAKLVNKLAEPNSPASKAALDKFRVVSFDRFILIFVHQ